MTLIEVELSGKYTFFYLSTVDDRFLHLLFAKVGKVSIVTFFSRSIVLGSKTPILSDK